MKTKTSILAVTKAFFILLTICCLFSCTTIVKKESNNNFHSNPITIIEFDNCEYVGFFNGREYQYTHKGNCKYCAERSLNQHITNKQEIKKIINNEKEKR